MIIDCHVHLNNYHEQTAVSVVRGVEAFEDYLEEQIQEVILYAGDAARLLYGTDWPICSMKSYVEFMGQLKLSDADRRAILYENSRRLFKLPLPPLPA